MKARECQGAEKSDLSRLLFTRSAESSGVQHMGVQKKSEVTFYAYIFWNRINTS